jgi:ribose transport system permease protein
MTGGGRDLGQPAVGVWPDRIPTHPSGGPELDPEDAGGRRPAVSSGTLRIALWVLRAGPALMLVAVVAAGTALTPLFLTSTNLGNVLDASAVIAVVAMGQLLVIVTRGVDLSVGSTIALSSVVGALVYARADSAVLVIGAILGTGLVVGCTNGAIFVFGRVPHPFIVTLATLSVVRGLALLLSDGRSQYGMPAAVTYLGGDSIGWLPRSAFVVAALALALALLLSRVVWGRWIYAVGGNPEAARRTGIPTRGVLVSVYALSGLAAGLGGLLTAARTASGSPNFGELAELDSIAAVIIGGAAFAGGRGNVGNALIGAFVIGVIRNVLNLLNVDAFYQLVAIGLVILLAVEADVVRAQVEERFKLAQAEKR